MNLVCCCRAERGKTHSDTAAPEYFGWREGAFQADNP
jgi:hypothetical protein